MASSAHRVDAAVKFALDVEPFDHRLGDPVALGQHREIVARIADPHPLFRLVADQARLRRVAQALEPAPRPGVDIVAVRGQVE